MASNSARTHPAIVPSMRYRDAKKAIDWLCKAFGFEQQLVVPGDGDTIRHSQLRIDQGMVMVATVREGENMGVPNEVGTSTQNLYVVVDDPEAHCARARIAGAEILMEVTAMDHGGTLYSCADPEGHVWNFGSYDPFAPPA